MKDVPARAAPSPTNDTFIGEPGNQTYDGGAGRDTIDYTAAAEALGVDLGIEGPQDVGGGFGFDQLGSIEDIRGGRFDDRLVGSAEANAVWGGGGSDLIRGGGNHDMLRGEDGDDTLDGGVSSDRMIGGSGNDTYVVNSIYDVVREVTSPGVDDGGIDLVRSSVTFRLPAYVENLTLIGSAPIFGTGNNLANVLIGNARDNQLWGGGGNDRLYGVDGHDRLIGGLGADTIIGGEGSDYMVGGGDAGGIRDDHIGDGQRDFMNGGEGDDAYVVGSEDTVRDSGTSTLDTVIAVSDYRLRTGDGIEVLQQMYGSDSATLIGNDLDNQIFSSSSSSGGNDLRGLAGSDIIVGSSGDDLISGGEGNDRITGALGRDLLHGGAGTDTFVYESTLDSTGTSAPKQADVIFDFETGFDQLVFNWGPTSYAETEIDSDRFADLKNAAQEAMIVEGASVADVVFVAGKTNGWLFTDYDRDGAIESAICLRDLNSVSGFGSTDIFGL